MSPGKAYLRTINARNKALCKESQVVMLCYLTRQLSGCDSGYTMFTDLFLL